MAATTTHYAAFLRGINPMNPNMRNDKLRRVFEGLGFDDVRTVIGSGNVLFSTTRGDAPALEAMIEQSLADHLGIACATIIRSREQLRQLTGKQPFDSLEHSRTTYLIVTFLKQPPADGSIDTRQLAGPGYQTKVIYHQEICSVVDTTLTKTPDFMGKLEKLYGKDITTRTWQTIQKVISKLDQP